MGDRRAKVFSVIFNSLLIIFLITPVGSVVVVQLLVLILAIMGIMIANFFWSTFLHATSVKTTEATLNEEQVIQQASSTVSGILISINLDLMSESESPERLMISFVNAIFLATEHTEF